MNYLTHLLLSENSSLARIGNLAGDFVKGSDEMLLHPDIRRGILLHRLIDAYTDRHPIVRQSKARIDITYRRFAGVLIDIFYDHFLANHWSVYSDISLDDFVQAIYQDLQQYRSLLTPALQTVSPWMIAGDWLSSYQHLSGISHVLERMSKRIKRANPLSHSIEELHRNYAPLEQDFHRFFPELMNYVDQAITQLDE